MTPLWAVNPLAESQKQPTKKNLTSKQLQHMKYFGLSTASTYGFLYLISYTSGEQISKKRLLAYSLGLPTLLGLGMYFGVLFRVKPFSTLIT